MPEDKPELIAERIAYPLKDRHEVEARRAFVIAVFHKGDWRRTQTQ
jgi:hypothetical protein